MYLATGSGVDRITASIFRDNVAGIPPKRRQCGFVAAITPKDTRTKPMCPAAIPGPMYCDTFDPTYPLLFVCTNIYVGSTCVTPYF